MRAGIVIVFMLLAGIATAGTGDQYLNRFSADEAGESVLIEFTTAAGFTCEDIRILAGTDSNDMKEIHLFPGICGNEDKEMKYSYTWNDPVYNTTVYIRIDMGAFGQSRALSIMVNQISRNESLVFPNPVTADSRIIFETERGADASVLIYDERGNLVVEEHGIRTGTLHLGRWEWSDGIYYYIIASEQVRITGKFAVANN